VPPVIAVLAVIVLLVGALCAAAWVLFRVALVIMQEAFDRLFHLSKE
jgi:hypothetical protein